MAYADKITNMRRMALIAKGHNIWWEGVNIDGECLLRNVDYCGTQTMIIKEEGLEDFCRDNGLVCVYQDVSTDDDWEPRLDKEEKWSKK